MNEIMCDPRCPGWESQPDGECWHVRLRGTPGIDDCATCTHPDMIQSVTLDEIIPQNQGAVADGALTGWLWGGYGA